jgi:4a-hydroxytetrahydrobiopterin dehydratase
MDVGELAQKKCVPCRGGIPPLEPERAREYLARVPGWTLSEDARRISKRFTFKSFPDAIAFVNEVAEVADSEGHHPDIAIHYREVELVLYTHKIGGLHENDFIMAAKIDRRVTG